VEIGFSVRCEKIDMEYVMNAPLRGKFQSIVDRGHHLNDGKRAVPLGRKLGSWLVCAEVASFEPHEVSLLVFGRIFALYP